MTDLERDLRELLDRRAGEAMAGATHRMPDEVRRRARRRLIRTALLGVAAGAALIGTVVGISLLTWSGGAGDGRPAGPGAGAQEYVVASGETTGNSWTVVALQKPDEWCLEFRVTEQISGICEGSDRWLERWAIGTGYVGDPIEDGFVVYGAAPSAVRAMYFEFDEGGRTEIKLGTADEFPDTGFNPFHAELPSKSGTIAAYPEAGQVSLFRQHFAPMPPPGPPPMTGFTPISDHFGNVFGELRTEELFGPPPLPGTEERSFAWMPPGLEAGVDEIRGLAGAPLALVWTEVGDWWANRPDEEAEPDELQSWWDAYPVDANLGLALGETFYLQDANGEAWAEVGEVDAITLRHATPGEGGRTASYLKSVASTRIPYIAPEAWVWWASRPTIDAPPAAFLEWWEAYPSA